VAYYVITETFAHVLALSLPGAIIGTAAYITGYVHGRRSRH
jgi:hypothetical protein